MRGLAFARDTFFVAAAVVVLVGGALLATTTIDRGPEGVAAPATTSELLAGLTVEEFEPGVLRILGDGFRDLTARVPGDSGQRPWSSPEVPLGVATGPDGSVWIHGRMGTFRLGVAGMSADGVDSTSGFDFYDDVRVAPDGSLWAAGVGTEYSVRTFRAGSWTQPLTRLDGKVAVGPDGTVWALRSGVDIPASEYRDCMNWTDCPWASALVRLGSDGSVATMPSWSDVHAGPVAQSISAGPDGSVWLMGIDSDPETQWLGGEVDALLRFDGSAWEAFPAPRGLRNWSGFRGEGQSFDIGSDGTLWAGVYTDSGDKPWDGEGLARLDASGWRVFTAADGVQPWGSKGGFGDNVDLLRAAPDGSVWMNVGTGIGNDDGVARFDGTGWSSYLRGLKVHDLAIAADGSVWVSADTVAGARSPYSNSAAKTRAYGLYVIRPNAAGE